MQIIPLPALKDNYIWAIVENNSVIIVDPGEAKPVLTFLQKHQLTLTAILLTHHHWDHINGVGELRLKYQIPIYGPAQEKIAGVTHFVSEMDEIHIGSLIFKILDIPGHTLGHIAYYYENVLFCGDTLFAAGCGRIFEGTAGEMYASLNKIAALPDQTKIYCAHEYTLNNLRFAEYVEPNNQKIKTRIEAITKLRNQNIPSLPSLLSEEKATNPFLRCDQPEIISSVERYIGDSLQEPVEVFAQLRKWKDNF